MSDHFTQTRFVFGEVVLICPSLSLSAVLRFDQFYRKKQRQRERYLYYGSVYCNRKKHTVDVDDDINVLVFIKLFGVSSIGLWRDRFDDNGHKAVQRPTELTALTIKDAFSLNECVDFNQSSRNRIDLEP